MTLQDFLRVIRRRWWIIALITLTSSVLSLIIDTYYTTPIYSNSTTLLINERHTDERIPLTFEDILLYEKLLGTYKDIIVSNRIMKPVAAAISTKYNPPLSVEEIQRITTITTSSNSQMMTIAVRHSNYLLATDLANQIAASFSENLQNIMKVNNVSIVDPAEPKSRITPVTPDKKLRLAVSFLSGLTASIALILILHLLDSRIRSELDLSGISNAPIIGSIPKFKKNNRDIFFTTKRSPDSMEAEAFRAIRTSLRILYFEEGQKIILLTSPVSGEGKTTAISNLGILTARDGKKVLMIDADLRNPHLHHIYRTPNRAGLSAYLLGHCDFENACVSTDIPGLYFLPAGPIQPNPSELLGMRRMEQMLKTCQEQFDVILIDAPAVLSFTDASLLSRMADGIVINLRLLHTKKTQVQKTLKMLEPFKEKIVGFILHDKTETGKTII